MANPREELSHWETLPDDVLLLLCTDHLIPEDILLLFARLNRRTAGIAYLDRIWGPKTRLHYPQLVELEAAEPVAPAVEGTQEQTEVKHKEYGKFKKEISLLRQHTDLFNPIRILIIIREGDFISLMQKIEKGHVASNTELSLYLGFKSGESMLRHCPAKHYEIIIRMSWFLI